MFSITKLVIGIILEILLESAAVNTPVGFTAKLGLCGDISLQQHCLDQLGYLEALLVVTSPSVLNSHKFFRSVTAAAFLEQAWPDTDNDQVVLLSR